MSSSDVPGRLLAAVPAWPVSDQARAAAFLERTLGLQQLFDGDVALGILRRDAVELHLWVPDGSAPGAEPYLAGSASCRVQVTEVDALHAHCARLGVVHPNGPLTDTAWGTREFSVLDPDHNLITLYERLASA